MSVARSVPGIALLVVLFAAAILYPEAVWVARPAPLRALVEGTSGWLPSAVATALLGGLAGWLLLGRGSLPLRAGQGVRVDARGRQGRTGEPPRRAGLVLALAFGLAVAGLALLAFGGAPVHVDAVVQSFQARILREGAVVAPAPPLAEFFVTLNTALESGRWFGQFPPGFPALLAVAGPGREFILHGVVAALGAYSVFRIGAALYGRRTGLLSAMLFAVSPFVLLLSASGLSHAAAAAAAAAAFWMAVEERTERRSSAATPAGEPGPGRGPRSAPEPRPAHEPPPVRQPGSVARPGLRLLCCGVALGALITIRPLDGLVVSACLLPLALKGALRRGDTTERWRSVGALGAGFLTPLALFALYNVATTGLATRLGYTHVWGPEHGMGFHLSPWGELHTLTRGLLHLHRDLWLLNAEAFGPALPLLPFAALPLVLRATRPAAETTLYFVFCAVPAAYVFYWHHDWFLGPRYLFTVFPFFAVLAARGVALAFSPARARPALRGACLGALAAGAGWLVALELPAQVGSAFALRPGFRVDVAREAQAHGISNGIVFVRESWGSRLLARLRGRGLTAAEAERAYRVADHCALELLLTDPAAGREELLAGVAADLRRSPPPAFDAGRNGDPTLRVRPVAALAPACAAEIAYDVTVPYGLFAPQLARMDPWLRGPLVVARDLGAEDERLVEALRKGPGYLYVPGRGGSAARFLPIPAGRAPAGSFFPIHAARGGP